MTSLLVIMEVIRRSNFYFLNFGFLVCKIFLSTVNVGRSNLPSPSLLHTYNYHTQWAELLRILLLQGFAGAAAKYELNIIIILHSFSTDKAGQAIFHRQVASWKIIGCKGLTVIFISVVCCSILTIDDFYFGNFIFTFTRTIIFLLN